MLEATFEIVTGRAVWGQIEGDIQDQADLQEELQSISGGLSDSIQAVDDKYDSITGALDDKIDSINGALSDSITALDNKYDSITGALDDKIDSINGALSDSIDSLSSVVSDNYNTLDSLIGAVDDKIDTHIADTNNPHSVTASQVGLGNVDNTSDADKPVSTAQQTALDGKVDKNAAITAATKCKISYDTKGLVTAGADLEATDIPSLTLSKISDVTATASEVNILDGATVSTSELNVLDGITANTSELNILDGATVSTTELNYVDGVTSSIQDQFEDITDLIPSQATTTNQLADKDFVNSSIATNTANFIGTFNSLADLQAYSGTLTNNDYAFVIVTDSLGNNAYDRYKYTTATTPASWIFEYELNNSSFTSDQWAAIKSLITTDTKVTHTANTAVGDANTPVYINASGVATALSFTIAKSVPSNAEFTDTTYTFATGSTNGTISVTEEGGTAQDIAVKGLGSAAYTSSSDYATPSDITNMVTTDTAQDITGTKTYIGQKKIEFKQSAAADKLGFTCFDSSNNEIGAFEYRPSTISGKALLNVNCSYAGDYVGFRYWGTNVNIVAPKVATAGDYYIPTHITNGNTTVTANNAGTVDISSLMPSLSGYQTTANLVTSVSSASTDSQYPSAKLFYDTCGDIETLINAL